MLDFLFASLLFLRLARGLTKRNLSVVASLLQVRWETSRPPEKLASEVIIKGTLVLANRSPGIPQVSVVGRRFKPRKNSEASLGVPDQRPEAGRMAQFLSCFRAVLDDYADGLQICVKAFLPTVPKRRIHEERVGFALRLVL